MRWGVVGGGMLGASLAQGLARSGHEVTLFESAPTLGGMASAWRFEDLTWDRHYHVTLLSDTRLRALLTELGLEDAMRWVETRTGFYTDGRLHSMSNALEFLRFPPLGLWDKFRLAATLLHASRIEDASPLDEIPVLDWLRRWSGPRTTERIWKPLLRAKLGDRAERASAAFLWAIIARMYAARRTGLKKEMFGYLPGGYARLLEAWETRLRDAGVDLAAGEAVQEVRSGAHGLEVRRTSGTRRFDRVVLTPACPLAARLCPDWSPEERGSLAAVEHQGIVCASVLLKRPLAEYYVTNITDADVPFTAVIEMTALVDPAEFGGRSLVYLPLYVPSDSPVFERSDAELEAEFRPALLRMYPHLEAGDLLAFQWSRVRHVLPISTVGSAARVPPMQTSVPGMFLVNSAQIVHGTLNVNETLQLADRALEVIDPGAGSLREAA